jgi:hypothetical protein
MQTFQLTLKIELVLSQTLLILRECEKNHQNRAMKSRWYVEKIHEKTSN